jgi:hypothetical protein
MVIRTDVKQFEQTVGNIPGIFPAYEQKNTAGSQQNDHSFGQFERRDRP